jgi:hypothetical protein
VAVATEGYQHTPAAAAAAAVAQSMLEIQMLMFLQIVRAAAAVQCKLKQRSVLHIQCVFDYM